MNSLHHPQSGPIAFVPAAPGWYAIDPVYEDEGIHELVRTPIVAWKIETVACRDGSTFTSTSPITIELERDPEALESPDGRFHVFEVDDFATAAELIDYLNERETQRRRAREKARNAERAGTEVDAR